MKTTIATTKETINNWPNYSYEAALEASDKVNWRVEDLIGGDKRLDFTKPFMPESLARVEPLDFLSPEERLVLNQIRGHGYLYTSASSRNSSCRSCWIMRVPCCAATTPAFEHSSTSPAKKPSTSISSSDFAPIF